MVNRHGLLHQGQTEAKVELQIRTTLNSMEVHIQSFVSEHNRQALILGSNQNQKEPGDQIFLMYF